MKMKRKDSRDATVTGPDWSLQIFADSSLSYDSFHFSECEKYAFSGSRESNSESKMSKNLVFVVALSLSMREISSIHFGDSWTRTKRDFWGRKRRNSIRNGECPCCKTRSRLSVSVPSENHTESHSWPYLILSYFFSNFQFKNEDDNHNKIIFFFFDGLMRKIFWWMEVRGSSLGDSRDSIETDFRHFSILHWFHSMAS